MTTSPQAIRRGRRRPDAASLHVAETPTPPVAAVAPPPKLRRRPMLIAVSLALVVLGAMVSAFAYSTLGNDQAVVAVRTDVPRGAVITKEDLQTVRIGVDPGLKVVPASQMDWMVGQRAAVDLKAGQLAVPGVVEVDGFPHAGKSVIGLSLGEGQVPGTPLSVGDKVRVVSTPGQQGDVAAEQLRVFDAVVADVLASDSTGKWTISVEVSAAQGPELAALSASGKVALLLDTREP